MDLPTVLHPPSNAIIGGLMILAGRLLAIWTIYLQFTLGRGTPVPVMATQKLITCPPYSYCRNPMALGAIGLYLGVSVAAGSTGAALLASGAAALLTYIRLVEEREMVARFGEEYLAYRRRVPFIIPRLNGPAVAAPLAIAMRKRLDHTPNTSRLTIRRFRPADADDLYEYLSDPQIYRFEPGEPLDRGGPAGGPPTWPPHPISGRSNSAARAS